VAQSATLGPTRNGSCFRSARVNLHRPESQPRFIDWRLECYHYATATLSRCITEDRVESYNARTDFLLSSSSI